MHKINFKYVPIKDDQVDRKLAEFINKCIPQKRMKCLFVRLSDGTYNYFKK